VCIASRTGSLPRNEKEKFDTPPEVFAVREVAVDPGDGLDVVAPVVVVLLDAGRDREDVRVEDDVLGREADGLGEDLVAALADRGLALEGVGLALLVEGHDHDRRAVPAREPRMLHEFGLAFLERDRVHDRLALHALEPRLDDAPLRAVEHDRHARDVGLGRHEQEEARHGRGGIEHRLVHVDVDHLRAALHLLARDRQRLGVVVARMRRAKTLEPVTLVRSPTFTKSESLPTLSGSSPRGAASARPRERSAA
jgi:hypothetical protein